MSKTFFPQAAALVLAVVATTLGVAGANALAAHQYARAVADDLSVASVQSVVVIGHRA